MNHIQKILKVYDIIKIQYQNQSKPKQYYFKKIINPDIEFFLENLTKIYPIESVNRSLITLLDSNYTSTDWKFYQTVKISMSYPLPSTSNYPIENYVKLKMSEVKNLFTPHQFEKKVTNLFIIYLFAHITEVLLSFKNNICCLLNHIKNNILHKYIIDSNFIEYAESVFNKFPCYIQVNTHNVTSDTSEDLSSTLKHQINIYQKLNFSESIIGQTKQLCGVNQKTQNGFVIFSEIINKYFVGEHLKISLNIFEILISNEFWEKELISNLNTIQNIWGQAAKYFRLKLDKKKSKNLTDINIGLSGISSEKELFLFDNNKYDTS